LLIVIEMLYLVSTEEKIINQCSMAMSMLAEIYYAHKRTDP